MSFVEPDIIKSASEVTQEIQDKKQKIEFLMKLKINDTFVVDEHLAKDLITLAKSLGILFKSTEVDDDGNPIIAKFKLQRVFTT